jgi:thioredoxin-like negative regulator of GroEL
MVLALRGVTNLKDEGQAMTMTTSMISRTIHRGVGASGAVVSVDEHERLALALLAVESGDIADVEDAMKKIIASAPAETDVALLLCLALAQAGDRALRAEVSTRSSVGRQEASGRVN